MAIHNSASILVRDHDANEAKLAAARAMLTALETLANWCEHEDASAKQCAPVIHARAAIAQAKTAGI